MTKVIIPDDSPPIYQYHPEEVARLGEYGDVALFDTRPASTHELIERLQYATAVINVRAYTTFTEEIIVELPDLEMISVLGTGIDNIDLDACNRHGVVVTNTPGCSTTAVAELTFGLMLAVARNIALEDRNIRDGRWQHHRSFELHGKILGVVGLGLIGAEVVRLAHAFGMRVIAWSFTEDALRAERLGVELTTLPELLRRSDVVSLHLRNSEKSRGLIAKDQLALMQPRSILINTSRAAIVDPDDLQAALSSEQIAGAGLDVFVNEPLAPSDPLCKLDNVVLTPHIGAATDEAAIQLARAPIDNVIRYLEGSPTNVVNAPTRSRRRSN